MINVLKVAPDGGLKQIPLAGVSNLGPAALLELPLSAVAHDGLSDDFQTGVVLFILRASRGTIQHFGCQADLTADIATVLEPTPDPLVCNLHARAPQPADREGRRGAPHDEHSRGSRKTSTSSFCAVWIKLPDGALTSCATFNIN